MERWRSDRGTGTHVLMDGGILNVPFEETHDFYKEYIRLIKDHKKLYIIEQKTEVFRFFVDLDYKGPVALSKSDILQYVDIMKSVVGPECYIATAEPRKVGTLIKSGVHIHWPTVCVTKKEALALRTRILLELPEDPEWNKRIDSSVYGGSGLRMLWSHKREKGVDSGPYIPWDYENITVESLELFSIRTNEVSVDSVNVELTCAPLERYIQRNMAGQSNAQVRRVIRKGADKIVVQTDSKYCERIKGEHKSNHVWFGIRGEKICQLCHDEDCKKFVGREHILSPSIVAELRSNVAVDYSTYVSIRDLVPDFWWKEESSHQGGAPVFGSRSQNMGILSSQHGSFRKQAKKPRAKSWGTLRGD